MARDAGRGGDSVVAALAVGRQCRPLVLEGSGPGATCIRAGGDAGHRRTGGLFEPDGDGDLHQRAGSGR